MGDVINTSKFAVKQVTRELLAYRDATATPTHLHCPNCKCETFYVRTQIAEGDEHPNILCSQCDAECKSVPDEKW